MRIKMMKEKMKINNFARRRSRKTKMKKEMKTWRMMIMMTKRRMNEKRMRGKEYNKNSITS